MGLCFDGGDLYFSGDGSLACYRDHDGDGEPDGPPEKIVSWDWGEHGGHAMRKGPDGWWYAMAGNETRFTNEHISLPNSPVQKIEAGALLRISPDGKFSEAIAHGFRNAYDFDFNWAGDILTYDSDVESDNFLPWYTPTRIYHIGYGQHHGWRLEGWRRSWPRPDYYADTVDVLSAIGRGSPTGVTCYRHFQFPPYYRNGLFALDWTFGKVYFLPLQPNGSSYQTAPEVFLEPIGTQGFAPTDIVVTPDGSLLISIGGRKTRGGIYRIESIAAGPPIFYASNWLFRAQSEAEAVLNAPQPLDAWSRAFWVPLATRLGPDPFALAAVNNRAAPALRVRAIEILTELHGGLAPAIAAAGAQANSPFVRSRIAWSLGRVPNETFASVLLALTKDLDSVVRRSALEALADHTTDLDNQTIQQALALNLAHPDKRVRQAAARLAVHLPDAAWNALWAQQVKGVPQARLTCILALLWRSPQNSINTPAIESALSVLGQSRIPDHRLQAIRLIILGLGDYHLNNPSIEVYTAYEPALSLQGQDALVNKIRRAMVPIFPSGDPTVDFEAARLLGMLGDDAPDLPRKVISLVTDKSSPSSDFHYLAVLSRLNAPNPSNAEPRIAHAILSLHRKLEGLETRGKQNWTTRLAEVAQSLLERDPPLADALLRDPDFAADGNIALVGCIGSERYATAARRYLVAAQKNRNFVWSGLLIDLLSSLPIEEVRPLFRQQWSNVALRDDLLLKLAQKPEAADRQKFLTGLASLQLPVARASLTALLRLPPERTGSVLVPVMGLLRRLLNQPQEQAMRTQAVQLLNLETGVFFRIQEHGTESVALKRVYQPVFDWFTQTHPVLARALDAEDQEDPARWKLILKSVPWDRGDALRGDDIFRERGCQTCHASSTPLGPDLGGVAGRLSTADLFDAIIFPSRDVAAPYRMTTFQTRTGQTFTGMVVFESADGVMVQTGATATFRLSEADIVSRQPSALSLMPNGLLNGLKPQELADLNAFLKSLPSH
jgi:putative heme-binding domain-containing protein